MVSPLGLPLAWSRLTVKHRSQLAIHCSLALRGPPAPFTEKALLVFIEQQPWHDESDPKEEEADGQSVRGGLRESVSPYPAHYLSQYQRYDASLQIPVRHHRAVGNWMIQLHNRRAPIRTDWHVELPSCCSWLPSAPIDMSSTISSGSNWPRITSSASGDCLFKEGVIIDALN